MQRIKRVLNETTRGLMLQGSVKILAMTGLVTGTYVTMINATIQPFILSLGVGVAGLGVMQTLGNREVGLSGSVAQPFAGRLTDIYGRRLIIIVGSIVTILSMLFFLLASMLRSWEFLVPAYTLFGASILSIPASQALIAESVEMDSRRMAIAYSTVFFFTSVPGVIAAVAAGIIADVFGYYLIFVLAICLETFDLWLYLTALRGSNPTAKSASRSFSLREMFLPPKRLRGFFAVFAADSFSFAITASILYGMIVELFGYSNTDIGLIVSAYSAALVLIQYPATRLLLKLGPKLTLCTSEILSLLLLLGWGLSRSLPAFVALSALYGAAVATFHPAQQSILMSVTSEDDRGSLGGRMAAFRGFIAFPAPLVGGYLFANYGYYSPMVASFSGIVITLLLMIRFLPEKHGAIQPVPSGIFPAKNEPPMRSLS